MMICQTLSGGCLCGAIAYEIEHCPGDVADICHCQQCRKASGAASLPWVQVAPARFRLTRGVARAYAASARATRWFCGHCGTPLYMTDANATSIGITLGTLDTQAAVQPTVHAWVCEAVAWEVLDEALPRYEKSPPYNF